jgi:hypothetical protein
MLLKYVGNNLKMIKYKKLTDYSIYKSIYDTVYDDDKSLGYWEYFYPALLDGDFKLYSILENDMTIATCGFLKDGEDVTIYELMCRKDYQEEGFGTKILSYTLSQIRRLKNKSKIVLAYTNEYKFFEHNDFDIMDYDEKMIDKYTMIHIL